MAEIRRGGDTGGSAGPGRPAFGERLPWLEPVEDRDDDGYAADAGGYGGVVMAAVGVLLIIALITAGILWYRHRTASADIGQIIRPEPGPYKIKPPQPGGMQPDMTERVAAATNAGRDVQAPLDMSRTPEEPIVTRRAPPAAGAAVPPNAPLPPQTPPQPAASPVASAPPVPAEPAGGAGSIQLGAFSSEANAKAAWKGLSSRFDFLKEMTPVYAQVKTATGTLYRLRAAGGAQPARAICGRMKTAGETCAVVGG